MRKAIKIIAATALFGIFIFSAVRAAHILGQYRRAGSYYDRLQDAASDESSEPLPDVNSEEQIKPPFQVDFERLTEQYPDLVGWLYCEGTPINYPVMQSEDNNRYLRRLPDGSYSPSGSLFADHRCGNPGRDMNYIIFGHNMKNDSMFGTLVRYKEQSYYDEHPTLWLLTSDGTYRIELCYGLITKPTSDYYISNIEPELRASLLREAQEKSTFISGTEIEKTDRLVTLSTCSYEFADARFIVIGTVKRLR